MGSAFANRHIQMFIVLVKRLSRRQKTELTMRTHSTTKEKKRKKQTHIFFADFFHMADKKLRLIILAGMMIKRILN